MTVQRRRNNSDPDEVDVKLDEMTKKGWTVTLYWDKNLKVWRAEGNWKGQQREGRGSTELLALASLDQLTPSGV